MSETQTNATADTSAAEGRKRAEAANFLPIVRGRLPLIFVHAIRFDKTINAMGNKDLASKFATSVGKVFDIKKGRNFTYVNAEFKPSAEDVAAAESFVNAIGTDNAKGLTATGDKSLLQKVVDEYKERGLASAEEAAALSAARGASRKKSEGTAPAASNSAPAASDNSVQAGGATADALLG
jgi:hypothetical protein